MKFLVKSLFFITIIFYSSNSLALSPPCKPKAIPIPPAPIIKTYSINTINSSLTTIKGLASKIPNSYEEIYDCIIYPIQFYFKDLSEPYVFFEKRKVLSAFNFPKSERKTFYDGYELIGEIINTSNSISYYYKLIFYFVQDKFYYEFEISLNNEDDYEFDDDFKYKLETNRIFSYDLAQLSTLKKAESDVIKKIYTADSIATDIEFEKRFTENEKERDYKLAKYNYKGPNIGNIWNQYNIKKQEIENEKNGIESTNYQNRIVLLENIEEYYNKQEQLLRDWKLDRQQ